MLIMLLGLLAILIISWYIKRYVNYWSDRGIPQGKQNFSTIKIPFAELVAKIYNEFPNERFFGTFVFFKPTLVIRDPEIIKQITIKDFDHFTDHCIPLPEDFDPLWSKNLFALNGEKWYHMRGTLSPAFTSSKMRAMFTLMSDSAEEFTRFFQKKGESGIIEGEMKDVFTRLTNDIIATCAFGVTCNSLKDRENEFFLMGKEATNFTGVWKLFIFSAFLKYPFMVKLLSIKVFSKRVCNFFTRLVADTVKIREEQKIIRPDMIHLLMEAQKGRLIYEESNVDFKETGFATAEESHVGKIMKNRKGLITDEDMTAQALIFFSAGFDSVATLMCFTAYELAINTDIQDALIKEIDEVHQAGDGKLTYNALNQMKYFDMVISETLRKWPPAPINDRLSIKTCNIPSNNPNEAPLQIPKGTSIWIPVAGIHHDEKYYKNPEKFDPERFNDENKSNINPYTYMPFGIGPRNCIGSRFALLESKTILFHILSKFEIVPTAKTPIPLKLENNTVTMHAVGGFWLGLKARK